MEPLRTKSRGGAQISRPAHLPAPTSGWYVGENQATPPPKTAVVLNNCFPELDYVRLRGGSQLQCSGLANAPVNSLLVWTDGELPRMFGVANGAIYDVSNTGSAGAPLVSGLSTSYVDGVQFEGYGGTYLIAVDGVDQVQIFDGTEWNAAYDYTGNLVSGSATVAAMSSTANLQIGMALSGAGIPANTTILAIGVGTITLSAPATATQTKAALTFFENAPITGVTDPALSAVWSYNGRLYFAGAGGMNCWYLGVASIGGPATLLPLAPFFSYGGYLLTGCQWTYVYAAGSFKGCTFISSEGEVLIYSGSYPADPAWTLVGQYKIARPLGRRCLMKSGGDMLIATEDGIVALSKVMTLDQVALQNVAVSRPVAPAWRDAVLARTGQPGWQIVPWPIRTFVAINLPKINANDYTQFVTNSRTGAWAQYLGWAANCFAVYEDELFYGDSVGNVWRAEDGGSDAGALSYTSTVLMAFSDLGAPSMTKQIKMVRPYVQAADLVQAQITINVDYDVTLPSVAVTPSQATGALWDVAIWDAAVWPGALGSQTSWYDARGEGTAIAVCWQVATEAGSATPDVRLAAFDVLFEVGTVAGG
jgi:hypothetical protein